MIERFDNKRGGAIARGEAIDRCGRRAQGRGPRPHPEAELWKAAGHASGAPRPRVAAERSVRPYHVVGSQVGAVDKDTLAAIYRALWKAIAERGFRRLEAQIVQGIGYTEVPVTVMLGDAIAATALLAEGRDHFFVRFFDGDEAHRVGTGIAGPFELAPAVAQPIDSATLAKLYRAMNDAAARGEMENLNGQLMQDIGYTPIQVSVPLGEEPVTATALLSTPGHDHFFVRFYSDDDPNKVGTGLAGPFTLDGHTFA
jgi:hypothetical protein